LVEAVQQFERVEKTTQQQAAGLVQAEGRVLLPLHDAEKVERMTRQQAAGLA
jgi:hypothetical protein